MEFGYVVISVYVYYSSKFVHSLAMLECEALNGKLWKCYWIIWQATIWVIWNARNNIILKNILNSFKTANQRTICLNLIMMKLCLFDFTFNTIKCTFRS